MRVILAATGCGQLNEIRKIALQQGEVVLGCMDGSRLRFLVDAAGRQETKVYFYETG